MRPFSVSLLIRVTTGLLLGGLLSACEMLGQRPEPGGISDGLSPQPSVAAEPGDRTADLVYDVLVGEVALQRGDFDTGYDHYLDLARRSGDPRAAERATKIALLQKQDEHSVEAVTLWITLAPENVAARQAACLVFARKGDLAQALVQLKSLLALTEAEEGGGFVRLAAVLGTLKDPKQRIELMRQIAAEHPNEPQARYAYALVAAGGDELDLAELEVRKALALRPEWPQAQVLLSRVLSAKGDTKGARQVLEDGLAGSSDSTELRTAYARLLVDSRDLKAAYHQFRKLKNLRPDDPDVLYALGILALQMDDLQAARKNFLSVYEMGKRRDEMAFYIGQIEEQQERLKEAREWYERAEGSYGLDAQTRIARLLWKEGDSAQARELLQSLRVSMPDHAVTLYLVEGELLKDQRELEQAFDLYTKALEAFPGNSKLLYARALIAADLGRIDVLEDDLEQIITADPMHADALNALGYTLADKTDRYEEAIGYIRRALALKPDSVAILDSMGWVQYRLGNYEEALRYLRHANELVVDGEIAAHLGEVLWVSGRRDEARRVWKKALKKEPESPQLRDVMRKFH